MKFSEAAFSLYQASLSPLFVVRKVKDTSQRHIGAVTTALHAHSTRTRLVELKKDRFTPTPCHCALPIQVSFPFHKTP